MIDLVVVGAGPAGMAGALAAADAGLEVVVIDEQARAGGQIFRRPPAEWGVRHGRYAPYAWATELIERFEDHPRIRCLFRSTAYGVLRDRDGEGAQSAGGAMRLMVAVHSPDGGELVTTRRVLLATGAYDLPVAFPGWTTPGVMTAGAAQSLLKSQRLLAGQRLVLAGSHPILLIVAKQMLEAGAQIAEIAFARGAPRALELAAGLPALLAQPSIMAEAARAARTIIAHRVKVSTHTIIASAQGVSAVNGVELVAVDANWRPVGTPRRIAADLLVLGYGFSPSTELARQAGCELRWSSPLGGWVVAHDESFRTSAAEIFVAGEPTGVSGAERSWAEGQLAGLAIADSLGAARGPGTSALRARAMRRLARAGRFAKVMQDMFEPRREALAALSQTDEAIVCRCELVTSRQIDEALGANPFISSANALKLECRSGMGPCQGRYCEATVAARVAQARGARIEDAGYFNAHLPVKPVPLSAYRTLGSETVRGHNLGRADSLADSSGADARADISPTTSCRKPAQ